MTWPRSAPIFKSISKSIIGIYPNTSNNLRRPAPISKILSCQSTTQPANKITNLLPNQPTNLLHFTLHAQHHPDDPAHSELDLESKNQNKSASPLPEDTSPPSKDTAQVPTYQHPSQIFFLPTYYRTSLPNY